MEPVRVMIMGRNDRSNATGVTGGAKRRMAPGALMNLSFTLPAVVLLGLLFLAPLGRLVALSLNAPEINLDEYQTLFSSPLYAKVLVRTFRISILVALGCLFFGYPIAYLLAESRARVRQIVALMVLLPFWTSVLVRNYAWVYLLQRRGALNELLIGSGLIIEPLPLMFNEVGVIIGMSNALLPFMVLPIYVAIQAQDRALFEAAESLGATPSRSFLAVTLPLSMPGVYAGSLFVFATALGFFITPALLGGGKVLVAATYITQEVEQLLNWPAAAAASIILLVAVLLFIAGYTRIMSIERVSGMGDAGT